MDSQYELVRRVRQLIEEIDTSSGALYNDTTILEKATEMQKYPKEDRRGE